MLSWDFLSLLIDVASPNHLFPLDIHLSRRGTTTARFEERVRHALLGLPACVRQSSILAAFLVESLVGSPPFIQSNEGMSHSAHDLQDAAPCAQRAKLAVVAAGTGTRCVGFSEKEINSPFHSALQLTDCHAEVLARRSLVAWLLQCVEEFQSSGGSSEFIELDDCSPTMLAPSSEEAPSLPPGYRLRANVRIYFYTSRMPCGACAGSRTGAHLILADRNGRTLSGLLPGELARGIRVGGCIIALHETEEVCNSENNNASLAKNNTLASRTKPGKGAPNLNLSCSDKLARWQDEGLQGSVVSRLFRQPVRCHGFIVDNITYHTAPQTPSQREDSETIKSHIRNVLDKRLSPALLPSDDLYFVMLMRNDQAPSEQHGVLQSSACDIAYLWCSKERASCTRKRDRDSNTSCPSTTTSAGSLIRLNPKTGFLFGCTSNSMMVYEKEFACAQCEGYKLDNIARGDLSVLPLPGFARMAHFGTRLSICYRAVQTIIQSSLPANGCSDVARRQQTNSWKAFKLRPAGAVSIEHGSSRTACDDNHVVKNHCLESAKTRLRADFFLPLLS